MQQNRVLSAAVMGLLLLVCGCASPAFMRFGRDKNPKAGPTNPVVQILSMWQSANGTGLDNRPTRGFAGQILFITEGSPTPAEVDGDVTIWVFDDQGTQEEQSKPIHKFKFPADSWKLYARDSTLGMSYAVFIPYTRPGRHQANCTLRVRFTPHEGPYLDSEMVNVELEGSKSKTKPEIDIEPAQVKGGIGATDVTEPSIIQSAAVRKQRATSDDLRGMIQQMAAEVHDDARGTMERTPRPLTDAERDRILRETRARLEHLNAGDESENPSPAARKREPNRRRSPNPLADEGDPADDNEDGDDFSDRPSGRPVATRHILDDGYADEYSDEDDVTERFTRKPAARRQRNGRSESGRQVRRNPLESDEPETGMTPRRHPLSIPLSERF